MDTRAFWHVERLGLVPEAIARALQNIVNREGSMVMAYNDDIVIATEPVQDHMVPWREVF